MSKPSQAQGEGPNPGGAPPAPVRVAHILNELLPSGAESMLVSAAAHWRALGLACDVIATAPRVGPYAAELARAGYGVHHVPVGRWPGDFLRLRNFLRAGAYQVAHQHPEGRGYWLSIAARSAGLAVVRTVHNNFPFDGNLRLRRRLQRRHLRAIGVRFVAIAPGVAENERERFGNPCELVWNWLDLARFAPIRPDERSAARAALGIAPQRKVLLSVGNCSTTKNHAAILEALARLTPRRDLHYLHVGVEDAAASERASAEALGVADRVRFLGWTADVRVPMAAADIFVMPSLFEGLGNAAIEALAVGLPAVLGDCAGLRDLSGIFPSVRYATPCGPALADTLEAMLSAESMLAPAQVEAQVRACRQWFDPARGAREYAQVYRSVLDRGRA
jgi:glycosyltransferase involved in cell wall biosynthesis